MARAPALHALRLLAPLVVLSTMVTTSTAFAVNDFKPARNTKYHAGVSTCHSRTQHGNVRMELVLTEENAKQVLDDCQTTLAAVFGNNDEAAAVGITGKAEFVELDGPVVVVRLSGRFWHKRSTVLDRISSFMLERIPECVAVEIEDEAQLNDAILPEDAD